MTMPNDTDHIAHVTLTDKVQAALACCKKIGQCVGCPYETDDDCKRSLAADSEKVIKELLASKETLLARLKGIAEIARYESLKDNKPKGDKK